MIPRDALSIRLCRLASVLGVGLGVLAVSPWLRGGEPAAVPLEHDFIVRAWGVKDGLPDDRVLSLLVDRQGFVWAGTRKGVARFDGSRFVTWSRSTHEAFVSEECLALAEDREGTIWVGTADGLIRLSDTVTRFDPKSIAPTDPGSEGHQQAIQTLCASDVGELLVGTFRGLVSRGAAGSWQRIQERSVGLELNCPGTALATMPDGTVWVGGSTNGLFRRQQIEAPWIKELSAPALAGEHFVRALAATRDGVLHTIVTYDTRFWQWPGRLLRRHATGWEAVGDFDIETRTCAPFLTPDSAGGLWFSITNRVVGHWLNNTLHRYALPVGVVGQSFNCMAEDAEGNLWAGTARDGLVGLLPCRIRTLTTEDGLPDAKTRALLEAADGTFWVGAEAGVAGFPFVPTSGPTVRASGESTSPGSHAPQILNRTAGLASDRIRALAEDARGRLWVGTGDGVSMWDGGHLTPVEFTGAPYRRKIRALHAGRDGSVWVGTAQGLYRFRQGETNAWLPADGLPHENVCATLEDRQGRVWIGMDGGGLARVIERGFERFDEARGLSSLRVWALHEDHEGALWIGTDRGLNVLRNDRIATITTAHGLPDNLVNSVIEDDRGWMWVGHDRGIYRVARSELLAAAEESLGRVRCIQYAEEDGLRHPETNGQISGPPVTRLRDGRIAFATMGGVALFDPKALPDLTNGPPAYIEELRAGGRLLYAGRLAGGKGSFRRQATEALRIRPQDRGFVEIHFAAVAFRAPDHVRFRHRLRGLYEEWVDAGALRQASFTDLRPGDYTFEVTAANHHGYASATPAQLAFRIEPIWHERAAVRVSGLLLLAGLVAGVVAWRLGELRRIADLEQQAALARERARLAKDLHDGLGANLTEITLLSGLGDTSHLPAEALAARFDRLTRSTHDALHSLRNVIWVTNPRADSLEMLASRLCESAERTLDAANVRCRLSFPAEMPVTAVRPELRRDVLFAVNEVINNIVRHARATEVRLTLTITEGELVLSIRDDGCGFDLSAVRARAEAADRGLGLRSLNERLSPHGGTCEIRSQPGNGTESMLRVPLPK